MKAIFYSVVLTLVVAGGATMLHTSEVPDPEPSVSQELPYSFETIAPELEDIKHLSCFNSEVGKIKNFFNRKERDFLAQQYVSVEEKTVAGREFVERLHQEYIIFDDERTDYVEEIFARLLDVVDEQMPDADLPPMQVFVVEKEGMEIINAFTWAGVVAITTDMLDFCQSVDEVAAVLGHEIGHNLGLHCDESIARHRLVHTALDDTWFADWSDGVEGLWELGSRFTDVNDELQADASAIALCAAAGYDPWASPRLDFRFTELYDEDDSIISTLLSTHPAPTIRAGCQSTMILEAERRYELEHAVTDH